jgi:hypothetical protein
MRSRIAAIIAAACLMLASAAATAQTTISDCCDWASGWAFSSYGVNAGTASAVVEGASGNPAARLNVTTVTPTGADTAFATAILTSTTIAAPAAGGAFTLSLDALSGAGGFGQGQGIQLLVEQGGSVYAASLGITGWPISVWTTLAFGGTFNTASFTRVAGAGPATPAFDGVTPTRFGFAAGNNMSATLTQYYDNFRLTIAGAPRSAGIAPIPTLSEWSMLALIGVLAAIGLVTFRRRR